MRFWPFGRKSEGVEFVTRVVTAAAAEGTPVRARMTLHFAEPVPEEEASLLGDRAGAILEGLLRQAIDVEDARGREPTLSGTVRGALDQAGVVGVRKVEVAGVHAVRLQTPSARPVAPSSLPPTPGWRPPSWAPEDKGIPFAPPVETRASQPPVPEVELDVNFTPPPSRLEESEVLFSPPPSRVSPPVSKEILSVPAAPRVPSGLGEVPRRQTPATAVRPPSVVPPARAPTAPAPPRTPTIPPAARPPTAPPPEQPSAPPPARGATALSRTRTSARFRAVTAAVFVPRAANAPEIASAVQPVVSDAAARLLVGALRFYDLLAIRGVPMSEVTAEMLAAVTPVSDAACGQYERSRSAELDRWRQTLGEKAIEDLHRECRLLSMYLFHELLVAVQVQRTLALATLDALSEGGGPSRVGGAPDIARYLHPVESTIPAQFVSCMSTILGMRAPPSGLDRAIGTVIARVQEELRVAALVVELSQRG